MMAKFISIYTFVLGIIYYVSAKCLIAFHMYYFINLDKNYLIPVANMHDSRKYQRFDDAKLHSTGIDRKSS